MSDKQIGDLCKELLGDTYSRIYFTNKSKSKDRYFVLSINSLEIKLGEHENNTKKEYVYRLEDGALYSEDKKASQAGELRRRLLEVSEGLPRGDVSSYVVGREA